MTANVTADATNTMLPYSADGNASNVGTPNKVRARESAANT